ncbi:hypothetical protein [Paenibacillus sp. OAS669]|uniref:hypothetical protein n=1 Tax=Paenibacillus sp. OAS669 TaxID=2663821 RepID=UPI0017890512|nr:hypothetical protein [Paenibacillus sp. OAS669]MBE1443391.1 hypothetical protein [Paenibacillus sp. OAS669]
MMNVFELEWQMKERQGEMERTSRSRYRWRAQVSMMEWLISTAVISLAAGLL